MMRIQFDVWLQMSPGEGRVDIVTYRRRIDRTGHTNGLNADEMNCSVNGRFLYMFAFVPTCICICMLLSSCCSASGRKVGHGRVSFGQGVVQIQLQKPSI